jgi:hypothetical protein
LNHVEAKVAAPAQQPIGHPRPASMAAAPYGYDAPVNPYTQRYSVPQDPRYSMYTTASDVGGYSQNDTASVVSNYSNAPTVTTVKEFVDPLGREGCPIVTFGFGGTLTFYVHIYFVGQVVIMFTTVRNRFSTTTKGVVQTENLYHGIMHVRPVKDLVKQSLASHLATLTKFQGPILKAKKKDIIKWLDEKIVAIDGEKNAAPSDASLLWRLLKLLAESDGKLFTKYDYFKDIIHIKCELRRSYHEEFSAL